MNLWISAADVRTYANLDGTAGRYSDAALGSNIRAAQQLIEQRTGRVFDAQTTSRTFTTEYRAQIAIPDVRSVSSVTFVGTALTANETYWLLPDPKFPTVYTAIQFRVYGRNRLNWYLGNPNWYDRGLDMRVPYSTSSMPNDLVITGDWGWSPPPWDILHATKVLAAWLTKRADGVLANAVQAPDGTVFDYSQMPPEVNAVIATYRVGEQAVSIF